jgi:2-desacetyl-2-hydroxyethyl bacteriochlorophyllide A dehydrogenase
MPHEIVIAEPRTIELCEIEVPEPGPGQVLLRILYSGISHGTEMNWYRGDVPQQGKTLRDGLFEDDPDAEPPYPSRQGYEEVGEVVRVGDGVDDVRHGERYAVTVGHRQYAVVNRDAPYFHRLPDDFDPKSGIFLALAGVSLDSYLSSRIRLGESAVIFGQGVVGLLLTHLCRLAGVEPIIAVDPIPGRREEAVGAGAHHAFSPDEPDLARTIRTITRGKGVDVAFEMSGSYRALHEAFRVTANPYGLVLAGGFFSGEGRGLSLGAEFHHSSHGAGGAMRMQAIDQRLESETAQWGLRRVLDHVWKLITDGSLPVADYITHVMPGTQAADAFHLVDETPEKCLKVVLDMTR